MNYLAGTDIGTSFLGSGHFLTQLTGVGKLVSLFLSNSILVAGIILLFIIIFAGYGIIGAGGNAQKVQASMKLLTYGVAGFLLVFATYFILRIIQALTGVDILP